MNIQFAQDLKAGLHEEIKSLLGKQKDAQAMTLQYVSFAIDYAIKKEVERLERARTQAVKEAIKERKRQGMDDPDWGVVGH